MWCEVGLDALVVGCCVTWREVECRVLGYYLCGVQALGAEEDGIRVRSWGFSKGWS